MLSRNLSCGTVAPEQPSGRGGGGCTGTLDPFLACRPVHRATAELAPSLLNGIGAILNAGSSSAPKTQGCTAYYGVLLSDIHSVSAAPSNWRHDRIPRLG
ncbi:hypothetical protein O1611_g4689 [Lasiodiplodia mahajangana]|uniref:Uncharacterized protein n=1 Tax=Lasiodiplodia mahajangana TaxID=1108764 RepID=A0ACC2JNA9_9PEZI|nr:hypothetical protein O1611_g4689 [Lasiodiplodia mahajangana]